MIQQTKQLNNKQIILYHLLPGVPTLLIAIICASPIWGFGLPIFLSLLISFAISLVPGQWIIMKLVAHSESKSLRDIIGYKEKMMLRKIILWALPGIILAAIIFTFGTAIEQPLWTVFSWVPDWFFVDRYASDIGGMMTLTIILNFIFRGLLLPFTEEIYFRGFLLPRMERLGRFAPIVNAALFSAYHLFAPWENVTRMLAILPFTYAVWRKKNIYIGVIAHCAVNVLSCTVMLFNAID